MKKKIAITYPQLHEFGGGEIFCEHIANLLIKNYEIDLYYYQNEKINKNINFDKKVNLIKLKAKNSLINFFCKNFIFLAQIYLIYIINKSYNNLKYEFIFSGTGEFISKKYKVYQYIHHPFYSLNPKHYLALGLKKNQFHKFFLRFIISFFVRFYFYLNKKFYKKNITFVNSIWTKKRFFEIYNKKCKVIYPTFNIPRQEIFNNKLFYKRKNNVVILGRVSADKETFQAIKFFSRFKNNNKDCKLNKLLIVGPFSNSLRGKVEYFKKKYSNDIKFYGYVSYKERNKILKTNKYGLHLSKEEHFGRSILEMQKKGMIVFSHNSGGAKEIVLNLIQKYNSYKDLEKKIKKLTSSKTLEKLVLIENYKFFSKNFTNEEFNMNLKKYLKK